MKKDVKIFDMDEKLWNWFVGYCKQQGKKVSEVIEEYIQKLKIAEFIQKVKKKP